MAAIPLSQIHRGYITFAPPWGKRLIKMGRLATPPGVIPPQLVRYATRERANTIRPAAFRVMEAHGAKFKKPLR